MSMSIPEIQSSLQKIHNEFRKNYDVFPESQKKEIEKAFRVLKSKASKVQSKKDKIQTAYFNEGQELLNSASPVGMEYYSDTDLMY